LRVNVQGWLTVTGNLDNFSLGTPVAEAKDIHTKWRESTESLIAACTRIADIMSVYTDQKRDQDRSKFIAELIDRGVLSKQDGKLQNKSSKLSKLISIGRNPYLQDRRVRPLLPPSYSTLYYICQLAAHLEQADAETATNKLVALLERHKGRFDTRTALDELQKSKKRRKSLRARREKPLPSIVRMIDEGRSFDLILMTPSAREIDIFAEGHAEAYLQRCFPLARLISNREEGVIVALALEAQHIQFAPVILSLAGRAFPQATTNVGGLKHSESTVLLTSDGISPRSKTRDWSSLKAGFQQMLETAYPPLRRRLHVFATDQRPGWQSLIAENCWVELPRFA
jgi:hypothetical protein